MIGVILKDYVLAPIAEVVVVLYNSVVMPASRTFNIPSAIGGGYFNAQKVFQFFIVFRFHKSLIVRTFPTDSRRIYVLFGVDADV